MSRQFATRVYRRLLHLYPAAFRERFGADMADLFEDQLRHAGPRGRGAMLSTCVRTLTSLLGTALLERRDALLDRPAFALIPPAPPSRRDGMLTTLANDLRFAVRMLRKSPVFTLVAVLVISLGTGAVTTIYSAMNALVLRPLPGVTRGDRLVGFAMSRREGDRQMTALHSLVAQLRVRARSFDGIAGWNRNNVTVFPGRVGIAASGVVVSGNFFDVLGVRPALGRFFVPVEDSTPLTHPVLVVSHAFWTTHLESDPRILGRTMSVNGTSFTVIGVSPPEFLGAMPITPGDVYLPYMMRNALNADGMSGHDHWVRPFARLRDGIEPEVAERELAVLLAERKADATELPANREWASISLSMLRSVPEDARGGFLGFISLLLGAAGLLMLIASVNVASMLSARAVARRREMALRMALGAGRLRLVRQLLTETLLLFGLGAAGGLLIAVVTTNLLESLRLPLDRAPVLEVSPDYRALAFALGTALVTGLVFGLAPALRASRQDLSSRLRDDSAGGGTRRSLLGNALIAGQLAASMVLLVSAGLFVRALANGSRIDPGFDARGVTTASFMPDSWGYDSTKARAFYRALRDQVAAQPGVSAVSFSGFVPMSMSGTGGWIEIAGRTDPANGNRPAGVQVRLMNVDADYFSVVKLPVVSGRTIQVGDRAEASLSVVVNETLARKYWPDGTALGRTFTYHERVFTVVGVAKDAKYDSVDEVTPPVVYFPMAQEWWSNQVLLVRSSQPAEAVARQVQQVVTGLDPALPPPTIATMQRVNEIGLLPQRIGAIGTALLGGLGLLMATVGLYGIISFSVARRSREIGVRVALGAHRSQVLRLIVGEGLRLTGIGVVAGLALAAGATQLLTKFLVNVNPLDGVTFGAMALLFLAVAALACYVPGRRAAATDPMTALRSD
ncbi:MAG: ABC transporter permease [Cytophagaceae bacterium]|nr:ABC transporter permease [Gemmatimonadaceae bacterium]